MFKKILVPVSSEYFPEKAMDKALEMSKYFEADVEVIYIIEEKMEDKIQKASEYVRTDKQIKETEKEREKAKREEFNSTMDNWEEEFGENIHFSTKIVSGEYSDEIASELEKFDADLVVLETEQESVLNYRLFYKKADSPVMIVR